jgi:hypothetical protein
MSLFKKYVMNYRCPVCLLNGSDPGLKYDWQKKEYFCLRCCFTGTPKEIKSLYAVMRKKYRLLNERLTLKQI